MSRLVPLSSIDRSPWADLFEHPEEHVARLADDIIERGIQTPLHVVRKGERWELLAGHDRLTAAERAGLSEVPVDERLLPTEDERFAYFVKDNTIRKDVDKRAIARAVLQRHTDWSDRRIADFCGTTHPTVASVRAEMIAAGALESLSNRQTTDGRTYPSERKQPPRTPTPAQVEAAREKRDNTVAFPVEQKKDGKIDALATMKAQREAQAEPLLSQDEVASRIAGWRQEHRGSATAHISAYVQRLPASIPDMEVTAADLNPAGVELMRIHVAFMSRMIALYEEAERATA